MDDSWEFSYSKKTVWYTYDIKADNSWFLCRTQKGKFFLVQQKERPTGTLHGQGYFLSANAYVVIYGPSTKKECIEYAQDLRD